MKRLRSRSRSVGAVAETDLETNGVYAVTCTGPPEKVRSPQKVSKHRRRYTIKEYFVDYTANSNLHGLKYIGEKERTFAEKIFWLITFMCCVVICTGLIWQALKKWNESPIIVSLAENPAPNWQIPFPAVSLCLQNKAMQTKFNFTEYYRRYHNYETYTNLTEEERNLFEDVCLVCDDYLAPSNGRRFSEYGIDAIDNIIKVAPSINDALLGCTWQDIPVDNCSELFSPILTEEGLCFTFNSLNTFDLLRASSSQMEYVLVDHHNWIKSWTLETGYEKSKSLDTYPYRGYGYGVNSGLVILKANEKDLDYLCRGPVQGFKIQVHNPAELPTISQQYIRLPLSKEVVVAVKPHKMTTSEGLKSHDPIRRHCYFPTERPLKYYEVYRQANCEMECLSNFTFTRCGCVHFAMPRGFDMPVCNSGSIQCMRDSRLELVKAQMIILDGDTSTEGPIEEALNLVALQCKCLPACTSIEYEAEISQANYDWKAIHIANSYNRSEGDPTNDMLLTRVMVFFKEAQFVTSRRSELYSLADILASCGGLLGLFMGFSILSITEIIYFGTLRLFCKYMDRNKKKAVKSAEVDANTEEAIVISI